MHTSVCQGNHYARNCPNRDKDEDNKACGAVKDDKRDSSGKRPEQSPAKGSRTTVTWQSEDSDDEPALAQATVHKHYDVACGIRMVNERPIAIPSIKEI